MGTEIHSKGKVYNPDSITLAQLKKIRQSDIALYDLIVASKTNDSIAE